MNIVARLDACITNMQSICNSIGMEATVEAIAEHTADELAACRDAAQELLTACKQAREVFRHPSMTGRLRAFGILDSILHTEGVTDA